MNLAESSGWQGYTYAAPKGPMPVLAVGRAQQAEYLKLVKPGTISFIYNRKTFHSYIRVGGVLFDMWGIEDDDRRPKIHVRSASAVFATSKTTRWIEAVMTMDSADVDLLLQFFFYRSAILEAGNLKTKHPWYREFVDRGTPPFRVKENCTGFILSIFNSVFFSEIPTVESLEAAQPMAKKIAKSVGVDLRFSAIPSFLSAIKGLPAKYKVPMVAAPPGLMRLVNQSPRGVAYLVHNVAPTEKFISKNAMNFEAKYGVEEAVDEGFDTSVRGRTPLGASAACQTPVKKKK